MMEVHHTRSDSRIPIKCSCYFVMAIGRSIASSFSAKEIDGISEHRLYAAENIVLKEQEKFGKQSGVGKNSMEPEESMERGTVLAQDGSQYHLVHVGESNMAGESIIDAGTLIQTAEQHRNSTSDRDVGGSLETRGSESAGRIRARRGDKRRNDDGSVKSVKVPSELR